MCIKIRESVNVQNLYKKKLMQYYKIFLYYLLKRDYEFISNPRLRVCKFKCQLIKQTENKTILKPK